MGKGGTGVDLDAAVKRFHVKFRSRFTAHGNETFIIHLILVHRRIIILFDLNNFSRSTAFFQSLSGNVLLIFKTCADICKNLKSGDDSGEVSLNTFKSDFRSGLVVGLGVLIEDLDVWGLLLCQLAVRVSH